MKQQFFEAQHAAQWAQLERWLNRDISANRHEAELDSADFPRAYRTVCQHLALARDRHYTPALLQRLNDLVLRGHQRLYQSQRSGFVRRFGEFWQAEFPRAVRREWRLFALSALLFYGSLLLMAVAIHLQPKLIYSLLDADQVEQFEAMYSPSAEHLGRKRDADSNVLMFGFYIRNNTGIGFQTFATGLLFGLGSIFFLVFNGLYIGAVAGHLTAIGYSEPFFSFVSGHSGFELTAIVLSGAAGLKMGLALIAPGRYYRSQALRRAVHAIMPLVYGFATFFLLAAFVEAFWSSNSALPPLLKYSVGLGLIGLLTGYFLFAGQRRAA